MSSVAQFVGTAGGGAAGGGLTALFARRSERDAQAGRTGQSGRDESTALPGRGPAADAQALPGRSSSPSASNVVRLPGQEATQTGGSGRPLIDGRGAFTLAVAIGLALDQQARPEGLDPVTPANGAEAPAGDGDSGETSLDGLNEEERAQVRELQARDAEVRRHEAAHAAAGGQFAGAPTFTYQTGPDGRQYAIGGEVSIDTGPVKGDPEATIRKAQQIKAAAAAPADPSSQDRRVAAQAEALTRQAQAELTSERQSKSAPGEAPVGETAAGESIPGAAGTAETGQGAAAQPASGQVPTGQVPIGQAAGTTGADPEAPDSDGGGPDARAEGAGAVDTDDRGADGTSAANRVQADAFGAAAASYRGPAPASRLVSIAV